MYISNDSGVSWTPTGFFENRVGGWVVEDIFIHNSKLYAKIGSYSGGNDTGRGIFMSVDSGVNWISSDLPRNYICGIGNKLFEVQVHDILFFPDNGLTWNGKGLKETNG